MNDTNVLKYDDHKATVNSQLIKSKFEERGDDTNFVNHTYPQPYPPHIYAVWVDVNNSEDIGSAVLRNSLVSPVSSRHKKLLDSNKGDISTNTYVIQQIRSSTHTVVDSHESKVAVKDTTASQPVDSEEEDSPAGQDGNHVGHANDFGYDGSPCGEDHVKNIPHISHPTV